MKISQYRKNNDGYCDRAKLHHQVVTKALIIAKTLYLGYSHLYFFNNATSHSVYVKDALQIKNKNKDRTDKQPQLCNR